MCTVRACAARQLGVASVPRGDTLHRQRAIGRAARRVRAAADQRGHEPEWAAARGDVQRGLPAVLLARRGHVDCGAVLDERHEGLDLPALTRALKGLQTVAGG